MKRGYKEEKWREKTRILKKEEKIQPHQKKENQKKNNIESVSSLNATTHS